MSRPAHVLLVEDNPGDARLAQEALRETSALIDLAWVSDGEAALDYLYRRNDHADARRPDIVLLDLNLPRRDGREVLEVVKSDADLCSIPVLILTTSANEQDVTSCYDRHANCYLIKPLDLDDFTSLMHQIHSFWLTVVRLPQ